VSFLWLSSLPRNLCWLSMVMRLSAKARHSSLLARSVPRNPISCNPRINSSHSWTTHSTNAPMTRTSFYLSFSSCPNSCLRFFVSHGTYSSQPNAFANSFAPFQSSTTKSLADYCNPTVIDWVVDENHAKFFNIVLLDYYERSSLVHTLKYVPHTFLLCIPILIW
jgi:hypothetical protein